MNAQWLKEQDYIELDHKIWGDPIFLSEGGYQKRIVWKLKVLKKQSKRWYEEIILRKNEELGTLESKIKDSILQLVCDPTNLEEVKLLRQ
jgi:hypothetical protein